MPTAYEKTYGAVTFYNLAGTKIFNTESDLGLWTSLDEEPSPEPKWIRVDVPGADGAVDLSRALAGQTTYEMREIRLAFGGKCADHATALALVQRMRGSLHGARVKVETLLTKRISGHYIADCECDGIAYASGDVEVSVVATADPFIRVGTQTLALPFVGPYAQNGSVIETPDGYDPSVAYYDITLIGEAGSHVCPIDADVVRLWWATGANLFDASAWPYAGSGYVYGNAPQFDGQRIRLRPNSTNATYRTQLKASDRTGTWPAWPYSFPFTGTDAGSGSTARLVAYVSGTVTAVGTSPHVKVSIVEAGTGTDSDGFVQGTASSDSFTPSVGSVSQTLTVTPASDPISAIDIEVKNVSGAITVGLALVVGTAPATWEAASLGYADVTLDAPIGQYEGTSDAVTVYPYAGEVYHEVIHDDGTSTGLGAGTTADATVGGMPPSDAKYVSAAVICDGGTSGQMSLTSAIPTPSTATGTNTTMRSTPGITTSGGAQVTIDGRTAIVGPGAVALPALVIPGGSFTVNYTLFGTLATDGTLTWEGGVL